MNRTCFALFLFICFILDDASGSTNVKFKAFLENVTGCQDPQPPFAPERVILVEGHIYRNKGKTYLDGRNTVLTDVPFQNFSISSYRIDASGRQELMVQAQKLNCRNYVSRLFLDYANFKYEKNNCRLLKGSFAYKDFDIDKVLHQLPNWHQEGRMLHRIAMTFSRKTIYCVEVVVIIKQLNK